MAKSSGSTDESIGRPSPWREGRYERSGQPVERAVKPARPSGDLPAEPVPEDPPGTPVTRQDYATPDPPSGT